MTCKTLGYIEKCLIMLGEDRERYNRLFETGFNLTVEKVKILLIMLLKNPYFRRILFQVELSP